MRLSNKEIEVIKSVIAGYDKSAEVHLFGPRVDDTKRGGDIDILIISNILGFDERLKIKVELKKLLGEQKIGLVIAKDKNNPFVEFIYDSSLRFS